MSFKVRTFLTGLNENDVMIGDYEEYFQLKETGFKCGDKLNLTFEVINVMPIEEGKQIIIVKRH
jgi:hypothetical protein